MAIEIGDLVEFRARTGGVVEGIVYGVDGEHLDLAVRHETDGWRIVHDGCVDFDVRCIRKPVERAVLPKFVAVGLGPTVEAEPGFFVFGGDGEAIVLRVLDGPGCPGYWFNDPHAAIRHGVSVLSGIIWGPVAVPLIMKVRADGDTRIHMPDGWWPGNAGAVYRLSCDMRAAHRLGMERARTGNFEWIEEVVAHLSGERRPRPMPPKFYVVDGDGTQH